MFNYLYNMNSYEETINQFSWKSVEEELGYAPGDNINIGEYCSDRICRLGKAEKTALIWQDHHGNMKTYTFKDIRILSNSVGGYLQKIGIKNSDRVCLFMDKVPELYIGFLGVLKIGAIVQPLYSAFGSESLFTRLEDAETKAIITQKKHLSNIRTILKDMDFMKYIIVVDENNHAHLKEKEYIFNLDKCEKIDNFEIFPSKAETPSVLHYTSGTTGKPKGAQHVHYSIISQYITTRYALDIHSNDIYWCTADPGWVTGTSYGIIGPWANGITQCVLDSGFTADNWYSFIEKHKISVWYSAPTAIRALMK